MGGSSSVEDDVQGAADRNEVSHGNVVPSEVRSCTDVFFLKLFVVFTLILIGLNVYCVLNGDIYRVLNGYDNYGTVCGRQNLLSGLNMMSKKFLLAQLSGPNERQINRTCLESCGTIYGYRALRNRCIPVKTEGQNRTGSLLKIESKHIFQEIFEDLSTCWLDMLILFGIAFVLSIIGFVMLKYYVRLVIWTMVIGVVVTCFIGIAWLWITVILRSMTNNEDVNWEKTTDIYIGVSVGTTILTFVMCYFVGRCFANRVRFIIALFKEVKKVITEIPLFLLEPTLTLISLALIITLWIYFGLWIESSGKWVNETGESGSYEKNAIMIVTRYYNIVALFWFYRFVISCEQMIIAGTVVTWFFIRNKNEMDVPICTSRHNLIRYHLGTVALRSLIIFILIPIIYCVTTKRVRSIDGNSDTLRCKFCCCLCPYRSRYFTIFARYMDRSSYVETAIFGYSFFKADYKALTTLTNNAIVEVIAVCKLAEMTLFLFKLIVGLVTVMIAYQLIPVQEGIHHTWVLISLAVCFAFFISNCFMTVYKITLDTIFLCFCEDCDMNDGVNKPYYTLSSFMKFVQIAKKQFPSNVSKFERIHINHVLYHESDENRRKLMLIL